MEHPQAPAEQLWPMAQALLQAPQFDALLRVSMQAPPQSVCPVGQVVTVMHTPAAHDCPLAQARPHMPQLATSVWVFAQVEPQSVCPAGHDMPMHAPFTQVCPAAHARPQPPQCAGSDCRLRHAPSQSS